MTQTIATCLLPGFTLDAATFGILGEGERFARQLGGRHVIIVAARCSGEAELELACRADAVVVADSQEVDEYQPESCLAVLQTLCAELQPAAVFLDGSAYSQEVAPRLAHRLGGSSIGDGQAVEWKDGSVCVTRSVYGGKAVAVVRLNLQPAVVWLRARSFDPAPRRESSVDLEMRTVDLDAAGVGDLTRTRITQREELAAQAVRLEDAEIIVSGGRGLGGAEPFEELKKLAQVLGAEVAASRAACDSGWVPPSWQVGQTGKKVAPQLYLAIAISGASQHIMGIADSKEIAAINIDAEAPIFRHCAFGLVEDFRNAVGPLSERLAEMLSE